MKKVLCVLILTCGLTVSAQTAAKNVKVPAPVTAAFAKEFPNMKADWEDEDGNFEAEFKINGTEASATYDKTGHRKSFESSIKNEDMPAAALQFLATNYADNKVTETSKSMDDQKIVTYEAEIRGKDGKFDLVFDQKGNFIKKIKSADQN